MAARDDLRKRVRTALDTLPADVLDEVATYVERQRSKRRVRPPEEPRYKPVALGGLWEDVKICDEDVREVRRELWGQVAKGSRA